MSLRWIHSILNPGLARESWCPKSYREDEAAREFNRARSAAKRRDRSASARDHMPTAVPPGTSAKPAPGSIVHAGPETVRGIRSNKGVLIPGLPALPRCLRRAWIRRWLELDLDSPREIPVVRDPRGDLYLAEPDAQLELEIQRAAGFLELRLRLRDAGPPPCRLQRDKVPAGSPKTRVPGAA